jgi:hypothetical protein
VKRPCGVLGRTSLHQVVSERELHLYILGEERGEQKEDRVTEDSVSGCLQVGSNQGDSQQDCERMKLEHSGMRSDSSRSVREVDRHSKMATEGHRKKSLELMSAAEMDKELADIKREMEELEMKMR